ncbi:S8 family serine peptidase [Nonomuraea sp. NPDC046570]|uniref:S8 family serine peptidase n=1 Tax=Nonomuraea sp. NPDC046570 TaxID=3155255 RepID=UPI00340FFE16
MRVGPCSRHTPHGKLQEPSGRAASLASEHGTFTASVLAGQHGSNLPGLAPGCRLLTLGFSGDEHVSQDPHSAARAIEDLTEAGANIIQYTPAHHTASHDADPMLKRAIAHAIEAGVLITAPAGNDYGRNSLAPAIQTRTRRTLSVDHEISVDSYAIWTPDREMLTRS